MNEYPKISEGILGEEDIPKTNTELFLSMVEQYFPEAIKDGEVDFAALKEEMGEFAEVKSEHYDFTWAGKQAAKKEAQADIYGKTLKYKPQDSLNADTTENIYIEGDNLEALKLLRRNYHGKIKMIYIDPPYNTGSDFVYRDDFSMTEEELAKLSGDTDENNNRLQKNNRDGSRFHTNWLNMIYPRMKIARELLAEDGVIFISIDDNEQQNLKTICNEIFGSENFIAQIIWERAYAPINLMKHFSPSHDYVICYGKNIEKTICYGISRSQETDDRYSNPDNDPRGVWQSDNLSVGPAVEANIYPITTPSGRIVVPPAGRSWSLSEKAFSERLQDNRIWFGNDGNGVPRLKRFLSELRKQGITPMTIWKYVEVGHSQDATKALAKIFDGKKFFDYPKPVGLIERCLQLYTNKNSVILDFFSGSATSAHAIMQLNAEDGGNRKFIMVQLPEPTAETSEAYKAGYKNICEIGKERIRRAAKKIHEENPDAVFDDGFKVFEVADTNIRWNTAEDKDVRDTTNIDYSKSAKDDLDFTAGVSDIDIVYEIMLRQYGIPLSTPIEKLPDVSDRTYIFADAVVVCLEPEITEELIQKLADIEPTPAKYILRDSAFNDDIELKDVSYRRLESLIKNHQTEEERRSKYNTYTVEFI